MSLIRSRWAAVGAAVAVTLGAGGIGLVSATTPADATTFIAITPCRLFDTRTEFNVGPKDTPLSAGQVHTVTAHGDNGNCTGIPNTAVAISMNMTALDATLPTFLTVWAAGATQPTASSLNPVPGAPPTPNAVTTELNGAGQFSVFNLQGNVNVFADINGYYVDHNHDDRYYTKTQTYDREAVQALIGERVAVGPAAFIPRFPAQTQYEIGSGGQLAVLGGTQDQMFAAVDLPHGATLTSINPTIWDDSTDALQIRLIRINRANPFYDPIFSVTSTSNSVGSVILQDDTPAPGTEVVDNVNYSYLVWLDVPGAQWADSGFDIRFHHLVVSYGL